MGFGRARLQPRGRSRVHSKVRTEELALNKEYRSKKNDWRKKMDRAKQVTAFARRQQLWRESGMAVEEAASAAAVDFSRLWDQMPTKEGVKASHALLSRYPAATPQRAGPGRPTGFSSSSDQPYSCRIRGAGRDAPRKKFEQCTKQHQQEKVRIMLANGGVMGDAGVRAAIDCMSSMRCVQKRPLLADLRSKFGERSEAEIASLLRSCCTDPRRHLLVMVEGHVSYRTMRKLKRAGNDTKLFLDGKEFRLGSLSSPSEKRLARPGSNW